MIDVPAQPLSKLTRELQNQLNPVTREPLRDVAPLPVVISRSKDIRLKFAKQQRIMREQIKLLEQTEEQREIQLQELKQERLAEHRVQIKALKRSQKEKSEFQNQKVKNIIKPFTQSKKLFEAQQKEN